MKKAYLAKLNMAQTCLAMIHAPEHAASQAASSKSWMDAVHDAETLVAWILDESQTLEGSKGISAAGKTAARKQLGDCAWAIASSLHALAAVRGLPDLAAATDITRSRLTRGTATAVLNRCTDIYEWATEHLPMLAEDNVKEADVARLRRCLETFDWLQTRPRETRVAGRAASVQLDALFEGLTALFKHRLDRLVVKFEQMSPEFHHAYWAARTLVRPATSQLRQPETAETVVDRGSGEAQPQPCHPAQRVGSEDDEPSITPRVFEPVVQKTTRWNVDVREALSLPLFSPGGGGSSTPPRSGFRPPSPAGTEPPILGT